MKILFVQTRSFSANQSGVPRVTYNLGKCFTEQGLEVAYFSFKNQGHISPEFGYLYHANEDKGLENNSNILYLKEVIQKFKPDVIINQMPYEKILRDSLANLSLKQNFKTIACIHNSLFNFKSNVKDIMRRKLPQPFGHIMATDAFSQIPLQYHKSKHRKDLKAIIEAHHTTLLFTPSNYKELEYFLNSDDLKDASINFMPNPAVDICETIPEKEKTILHVGSINIPQKRSDLLLDFWENLYKDLPDWNFKILGHGPYYKHLEADLNKRQLPRFELLGFQKPEAYYQKASIFMMPSAYEGFPNTILEAQSYGCPVLAFNSYAAIEWIVGDNNKDLLANPFDVKSLSKKCLHLAKNENYLNTMQEMALNNVKRFALDKIAHQWQKLFQEII